MIEEVEPRLWLRLHSTLRGKLATRPEQGPFSFAIQLLDLKATVTFAPTADTVTTTAQAPCSDELLNALRESVPTEGVTGAPDLDDLPSAARRELRGLRIAAAACRSRVLLLVEQELWSDRMQADLLSGSSSSNSWSSDGSEWYPLPHKLQIHAHGRSYEPLTDAAVERIQALIDRGERALLATPHLLHARRAAAQNIGAEKTSWVNAAIAAEIGVKEILVRLEPALQTLLVEAPAPPLSSLYGRILKAYGGGEFPGRLRRHLQSGAHTRNKIVHSPQPVPISPSGLHDYLDQVEEALKLLLKRVRAAEGDRGFAGEGAAE